MTDIPARPPGAIPRPGIIDTVQSWPEYAKEKVIDCYSVIEDGETILKIVTVGDRSKHG